MVEEHLDSVDMAILDREDQCRTTFRIVRVQVNVVGEHSSQYAQVTALRAPVELIRRAVRDSRRRYWCGRGC